MVSREELAQACRAWGGHLWLPPGIDGPKLLWAISGCESSFGVNTNPRQEPYYTHLAESGKNEQLAALAAKFGIADAASSFGPWQELLVNCSPAMTPADFASANRAGMEVASFINNRILKSQHATTVTQIAEAYNSGKWAWLEVPPGVARYAADCQRYYETEALPA